MVVCLFMILGFPQETEDDIQETFKFIRKMAKLGIHEIAVSTFVPLPGTQLFHETTAIKPITIDDDYCYSMTGATRLFHVKSWNPRYSDLQLRRLKLRALLEFYSLSYGTHPSRVWKLVKAAITGRQQTKVDHVVREFALKLKRIYRGSDETINYSSCL